MKTHIGNRPKFLSVMSLLVLGIFIFLSIGSLTKQQRRHYYVHKYEKTYDESLKLYKLEENLGFGKTKTTWGNTLKGQWHGAVRIKIDESDGDSVIIVTNMYKGKRHGINVTTLPDGTDITHCYKMGNRIDCSYFFPKSRNEEDKTSYQYLNSKYPWLLIKYNAFGFDNTYIEAFMDTLETIISTNPIDVSLIDEYYDDAIEILENKSYDSIIRVNTASTFVKAIEDLKDYELRCAIVDHYLEDNPTFQIIQTKYSNYPEPLYNEGGSEADFEVFCKDLDDTLASYGPLDPEDPFFYDSVDTRLQGAILRIYAPLESEESISNNLNINNIDILSILRHGMQKVQPFSKNLSSPEIAEMVLYEILMTWINCDLFKKSIKNTYLINNGAYVAPTVTTVFLESSLPSRATVECHVIENGGAELTSRGVAWATIYNPDIDDNKVEGSLSTGDAYVSVTIEGLTEGITYYARSYATNSAGTSYGNCISFIAGETTGPENISSSAKIRSFTVFPNPASTSVTLELSLEHSEIILVSLVNLKGQEVMEYNAGILPSGATQVKINLTDIPEGLYTCRIIHAGERYVSEKIVVVH